MGRREDGREEKDGGGKEESKGKSGCAPPETKSWLRHWVQCLRLNWLLVSFQVHIKIFLSHHIQQMYK